MKKRQALIKILITALIVLAIVIAVMVAVRVHENRFDKYIDKVEVAYQDSNGIRTTNYIVILNPDIDWNTTTDREGIAKYTVNAAIDEANSAQVRYFNVIGQSADRKVIFMYVPSAGKIVLYEDGKPAGEVPFG